MASLFYVEALSCPGIYYLAVCAWCLFIQQLPFIGWLVDIKEHYGMFLVEFKTSKTNHAQVRKTDQ